MTDKIISRREDGVGHVVFNNPEKRNAVSLEMWREVDSALSDFARDCAIRAVVVTGAGDKAFVSGADVSKFETERASKDAVEKYNLATERAYTALHGFPKPTIARIRGACVGGGVNLAVCCDLRLCSEGARFAIPAARLGIGYGHANMSRLVDAIGVSCAMEMLYTARTFDAEEALRMGLVNQLLRDEELDAGVDEYARRIAGNAPLTIALAKAAVGELRKDPALRDIEKLERMVEACSTSQDYVEGRRAFIEKREPRFTGA